MHPDNSIGLAETLNALRSEMEHAIAAAEGHHLQFEANDIKIELRIGVTRSAETTGGIQFWVVQLGGKASYSTESLQTLTLSLKPTVPNGRVLVTGQRVGAPVGAPAPEGHVAGS